MTHFSIDWTPYYSITEKYRNHETVLKMKSYMQHGTITTYDHCESVAKTAFYLSRALRVKVNDEDLLTAAFLHDFFLYDWHDASIRVPLLKMHGFTHPEKARKNAVEIFEVNDHVQSIISSHMWPLTFFTYPKSKEAFLICLADKIVASKETIFERKQI